MDSLGPCKCCINIHHMSIKAKGSIAGHSIPRLQIQVTPIPTTPGGDIALFQNHALGHAGGAGGIQKDHGILRGDAGQCNFRCLSLEDLFKAICGQPSSGIFFQHRTIAGLLNDQCRCGILDHKVKPLCGIGRIKGLKSTACLHSRQRGDHHIFIAGDQNGNHRLSLHTGFLYLFIDHSPQLICHLIQFLKGILLFFKDQGRHGRILLHIFLKQRQDILLSHIRIKRSRIKLIQRSYLLLAADLYLFYFVLCQQLSQNMVESFQEMSDQSLAVKVSRIGAGCLVARTLLEDLGAEAKPRGSLLH